MIALKLIPHLLTWSGIVLIMVRAFPVHRQRITASSAIGFVIGVVGTYILFRSYVSTVPYAVIKSALGMSFLLLWFIAVAGIYRSSSRNAATSRNEQHSPSAIIALSVAVLASIVSGAICTCRFPGFDDTKLAFMLLMPASAALAYFLAYVALAIEKRLPPPFKVSQSGMLTAVVALLLFSSSSILRLDLFSPLSMKVMKGFHDFVHQFMESILVPDHLFVRSIVWKYIGLLFGKEVGFWGGIVIWFTPAILVVFVVFFQRLPSVAHIRQGAQRRKLLAAATFSKRCLLVVPLLSVAIFAASAYQSRFPSVEYWDPKPLPVTASPAGEIFIPKKGEIDLLDGKLHKYIYKQGEREARFFVLMLPSGQFTVDLDACAICKPDGYGQAEGTVICYYCVTLIPLETVGKPGGCNPVPVPFTELSDGVSIDGSALLNSWGSTVKATARVKDNSK